MQKAKNPVPYQNYFGGKSGAGVYQSIINHIPPHRLFITLFAGNCGVFKNIRRPEWSIINDLNLDVIRAWDATGIALSGDVELKTVEAVSFLKYDIRDLKYAKWLKHTFIYLDPPYLDSTRRGQQHVYKCHFGNPEQHIDLLNQCLLCPPEIKIMISHYPCVLYDTMLKGWHTFDFQAKTRQGMVTERIYMNYPLDGHLHDYSYIGQNFRERERHNRIKNNFFAKLDRMEPLLRNKILQEYELTHFNK